MSGGEINRSILMLTAMLVSMPGSWAGDATGEDGRDDVSSAGIVATAAAEGHPADATHATPENVQEQASSAEPAPEGVVMRPLVLSSDAEPCASCGGADTDDR